MKLCRKKTVIGEIFSLEFPASFDVDIPPFYMNTKRIRKIELEIVEISE